MTNSSTIAPQVSESRSLFEVWRESNIGRYSDFIRFITKPSGERSRFLMTMRVTGELCGSLLLNQVTTGDDV